MTWSINKHGPREMVADDVRLTKFENVSDEHERKQAENVRDGIVDILAGVDGNHTDVSAFGSLDGPLRVEISITRAKS